MDLGKLLKEKLNGNLNTKNRDNDEDYRLQEEVNELMLRENNEGEK